MTTTRSIRSILTASTIAAVLAVGGVAAADVEMTTWAAAAQAQYTADTAFDVISESNVVGVEDGESVARNLVVSKTDRVSPRDIVRAHQCLPDGEELYGQFTVALVDEEGVDERQFAQRVMGDEFRSANELYPEVRIAINYGDGDWDYALGNGWHDREQMRRYFAEAFVGRNVELDGEAPAANVCRIVGLFNRFLETADGDSELYFERRQIESRESLLRRKVASTRGDVLRSSRLPVEEDSVFYRQHFEPRYDDAERAWLQTRESLREDDIEAARESMEKTSKLADELRAKADRIDDMRAVQQQLASRLEEGSEDWWLRSQSVVPFGTEIEERLHECGGQVDEFADIISRAPGLDEMERQQESAQSCVDSLQGFVADTERSFRMRVIYGPLSVLVVALSLGGVLVARRRRQAIEAEPDAGHLIDQWGQRTSQMKRRLESLAAEYPELFDEADPARIRHRLDAESREVIDHAFIAADRADELLGEAVDIYDDIHRSSEEKLDEIEAILQEGTTSFHPDNTAGKLRLQERLQRWHNHDHGELLDDLEDLVERAEECLEKSSS